MNRRQGFALITVLIAIAILTTIVVELQYSSAVHAKITINTRDRVKGYYLALSGYNLSLLRIQADSQIDRFMGQGQVDHLQESIWNVPLILPMPKEMVEQQVEEGNMSRNMADQFLKLQEFGGQIYAQIEDESAKINLNDLRHYKSQSTNYTFKVLEALLYQPQFSPYFERLNRSEFIDNLIDWIDEDSSLSAYGGGTEDLYYSNQKPPYQAKNLPFFSVAEIKLVKDVDQQIFNKMAPFVTVYPYNIRLRNQESGTLNVNTAGKEVIAALFSLENQTPEKSLEMAELVIEYRKKYGAFKNGRDFSSRLEKDLAIPASSIDMRSASSKLTGKSDLFRISSSGIVNNRTTTIEAVVKRNRSKGSFNTFYYQVR